MYIYFLKKKNNCFTETVCVFCTLMHTQQLMYEFKSQFSSSTKWDLISNSGLVASVSTC